MSELDEAYLHSQASLGKEADDFWRSNLGRYILARSLEETESIRTQFRTVDANDSKAIAKLQADWNVAEKALVWLQEAIQAGKAALDILEQQQQ